MQKALIFFTFLLLLSCGRKITHKSEGELTLVQYNVENLFDTENDKRKNDEDFLPNSEAKWTQERYNEKLENLSDVLLSIEKEKGLDILCLVEVENYKVLEDLLITSGLQESHSIVHMETTDGRGIDQALIYANEALVVKDYWQERIFFSSDPSYRSREILFVEGLLNGEEACFALNHWPSRRGGLKETEQRRNDAASFLVEALENYREENPKTSLILMGDFNDEPENKSMKLLSDNPELELHNPFLEPSLDDDGSYRFRGNWNMLDQIIISESLMDDQGNLTYINGSAEVFEKSWMIETHIKYYGAPLRTYAGYKYIGGYSDHFPVLLRFKLR